VKTDIDGLLARATADCADPTDLMEFTSSLIAYIKRLEMSAAAVVSDLELDRSVHCPTCGAHLRYQDHGRGCSLRDLAALLEETP